MIRKEIKKLIKKEIKKTFNLSIDKIEIEVPAEEKFGDYATNLPFLLAQKLKKNPQEIGERLIENLNLEKKPFLEKIELINRGFLNFFLSQAYLQKQLKEILKKREHFGQLNIGKRKKVNVEFISANPTGPLTLGNGRGGFWGDVLSNVLEKAGYQVTREYYINDMGEQIKKLGYSILALPQGEYRGEYIKNLRKRIKEKDPFLAGQKGATIILKEFIKPTIKKLKIKFDVWFSERSLYQKGEVEKVLNWLKRKKLAYQKEGALWFFSTLFGDEKDRVLVKADGEKTYFASDISYLKNKFQRGFEWVIFLWGADHQGYLKRMEGAVRALGYKKRKATFIIFQLVHLLEKGKEVKMSKRKGIYLTLEELVKRVGLDVARFFFLQRSPGNHLNFDLDLAKTQSEKNPVYYIQYAHARIASILRKNKAKKENLRLSNLNFRLLNHPTEQSLIKHLLRFPELIEDIAGDCQVQRLPQYSYLLAERFHRFYRDCKVLKEEKKLKEARLGLVLATKIVLKQTLNLMGISAPEKM